MKAIILLCLLILVWSQSGSINLKPIDPTLFASTSYNVSFYTFNNMFSSSTINLNFTATYITVPNGALNVTATINGTTSSGATANCTNSICTLRMNKAIPAGQGTSIAFVIGNLVNPFFLRSQSITANVTFNASYSETPFWVIPQTQYTPMPIASNYFNQSDYGVGNTDVSYFFSFQLPISPPNVQLSLTIPQQVGVGSLQVSLSYYGSPQVFSSVYVNNIYLLSFSPTATNTSGTLILNISGLTNPQSIGSSGSFVLQMLLPNLPGTAASCTGCVVSSISSGLLAKSIVPGKVQAMNIQSTDRTIGKTNTISIYTKVYASIPAGGMYKILLPTSIKPILPVNCFSSYGFTMANNAAPSCSYDSSTNSIYTNNFIFLGSGDVVIGVTIKNAPDTTPANFYFQTFDSAGNMIGNSTKGYSLTATPLQLTAISTKSNYQVDSTFKLTVNCTLAVDLTSSNIIRVTFPQASYSTGSITCSSGTTIACSTAVDQTSGILIITLRPPCTQCSAGTNFLFAIDGLTNPSFISSDTQKITIDTATATGLIQSTSLSLPLTEATLSVSNYNRSGANAIGTSYSMSFTYTIPAYITTNGGLLLINFNQYDTYVNPIYDMSSATYSYPTSLVITDSQGKTYTNNIVYYSDVDPTSIKQIAIDICGSDSCGTSLVISGIRKGFSPLSSMVQNMQITTVFGESVSSYSFNVISYNVIRSTKSLGINLSNSVTTLNSNYVFTFTSQNIPFQNGLTFSLSTMHIINGGCLITQNSTIFTGVLSCTVVNTTSVSLIYNGDINQMLLDSIQYTLTIINVTNPVSVAPLSYSISTQYNNQVNQQFSVSYSIATPLPLSFIYSKANNTFGQSTTLNISIVSNYPTFSEIKLSAPSSLISIFSLPSSSYTTTMINNAYQIGQIYSLSSGSFSLNIINPNSTNITGNITVLMYSQGYLAATGNVVIQAVTPLYLGLSATSSNRIVGGSTNLSVKFDRVNSYSSEAQFLLNITNSLFDCTYAKYNNSQITFPLTIPIGLTTITITNVTNLLYIPQNNPSDGLRAWTVDESSYTVAVSSNIPNNLIPNAATTGLSWAFSRTNTAINGVGALNIIYTPRFPTSVGIMKVVMPINQTTIASPSCLMQGASNNANACSVLSSSTSTITLSFFNQTTTSLTNVINLEPNSNLLQLYLYTINNELVEYANGSITPNIQFNSLSVTGNISSNVVATNNQINMNITSPNAIDIGSKIVISLPSNTFTRISTLVSQDCTYSINGTNYNACQYVMTNEWVNQVNITYLGPLLLPINTPIQISIFFTNAWSVTFFSTAAITVYISSPTDNYVSQGVLPLISLFGALNSLQPTTLSNVTLTQTSTLAGKDNIVTISFTSNIPLPTGTNIIVSLPKSAYTLTDVSTVTGLKSNSENTTHYLLTLSISCIQSSPLCSLANSQFSTTVNLKNNPYVQLIQSQFSVQLLLSSNIVSSQTLIKVPTISPQTIPSISISRSSINAFANTNISIATTNPTGVSAFTVIVSPISTATTVLPLLRTPTSVLLNTASSLSYNLNSSSHIIINVVGATGPSSTLTILGQNNLLIPTTTQKYTVTLIDSNAIYFTAEVTPADTLAPYGQGLNLQRIVTTVSTSTNVYLFGTLPIAIPALNILFNSVNYSVSGSTFNISLGSITNSMNLSDSTPYSITLRNNDVIAFKSSLQILPALTPQNLSTLTTLTIPSQVNISSNFDIKLELTATPMTYLSIKTAPFFNSLIKCCIDLQCQNPISLCKLTQTATSNLIQVTFPSSQQITFIAFTVTSLQYQKIFMNQVVVITSALPSSTVTLNSSITISATNLTSSLSLKNWKVNQVNTYNVNVQPIAKEGFMRISLPSFISSQLDQRNYNGCTMIVNGTQKTTTLSKSSSLATIVTQIAVTTPNISLVIASIQNPMDNFPYALIIEQSLDDTFSKIHAVSTIPIVMKQFDNIVITSAVRTVTKVNVQTQLYLQISSPYSTSQLILNFPISQLVTGISCSILINEDTIVECAVINSTAILTKSYEGITKYTISGLKNQNFYDSHTAGDVISAQIGKPYIRALTSSETSSAITPRLTLGTITLNSIASSSQAMLQSSTLTYNITIQNTDNIDGFIIEYSEYHYLFSNKTTAKVNGQQVPSKIMTNHSIFIAYPNPSQNNLLVNVNSAYNFIKPASWSFKSVRSSMVNGTNTFSDVDLYYNNGETLTALQPSSIKFRVILPNNYVQTAPVEFLAVIDTIYQFSISTLVFNFNFTTQSSICSMDKLAFSSTLALKCTFTQAIIYNMQLQMYHTSFPSMPISVGSAKVNIYSTPTDSCDNNMCDLCSKQNGNQYCFKCREGMFSANGQCQDSCPSGSFPYLQTKICQQCSPTCTTCYNLYSNNCLSCKNSSLSLDSGKCSEKCPIGSLAYNGYCTDGQQCQSASGCRLCSNTGFCYECLPDYNGEPNCQYQNAMPPTLMIYVLIPFLLAGIIPIIIAAVKCVGADSILSQAIFSFSFIQLFAWACTVPVAPSILASMALISFITIRVIISIVSYQVFYKKNMGQLSQKLLEEQSQKENEKSSKKQQQEKNDLDNWKTKLVRLFAHFNGPDSYELLKCKISEPVLSVNNSLAAQALFMANRWVACFLMIYLLSVSKIGDSVFMPLIVIACAGLITICRLLTVDKVRKCLTCFRT